LRSSTAIFRAWPSPLALAFLHRFDQFAASGLETVHHHLADSLGKIVAKGDVFVVMPTQNIAIEEDRSRGFDRTRIEVPSVRREKPGPTQRFAVPDDVGSDRPMFHYRAFQRDSSTLNKVETMCWFARPKNYFIRCERLLYGVTREKLEMVRTHSGEKRMRRDLLPKIRLIFEVVGQRFGFHT
jgi:hypothetical protein